MKHVFPKWLYHKVEGGKIFDSEKSFNEVQNQSEWSDSSYDCEKVSMPEEQKIEQVIEDAPYEEPLKKQNWLRKPKK